MSAGEIEAVVTHGGPVLYQEWIVQQTLPVEGGCCEVELPAARHAGSARSEHVGSPGSVAHSGAVVEGVDGDASVDDWDEVGVGEEVGTARGQGRSTQLKMTS